MRDTYTVNSLKAIDYFSVAKKDPKLLLLLYKFTVEGDFEWDDAYYELTNEIIRKYNIATTNIYKTGDEIYERIVMENDLDLKLRQLFDNFLFL